MGMCEKLLVQTESEGARLSSPDLSYVIFTLYLITLICCIGCHFTVIFSDIAVFCGFLGRRLWLRNGR